MGSVCCCPGGNTPTAGCRGVPECRVDCWGPVGPSCSSTVLEVNGEVQNGFSNKVLSKEPRSSDTLSFSDFKAS